MNKLKIGTKVSKLGSDRSTFLLPVDIVTETISILAKRGAGKTYTAMVIVEEMMKAMQQVIVLDPLDVWWGLSLNESGKRTGLEVIILGGANADLPLEASSGKVVADFAIDTHLSLVISLRHFSKNDQKRFVADFCEQIYRRKGNLKDRAPLHLVIDEADAFVPQRVFHGMERMVGAIDDLVRRGRASGIGVTLITQRAAVVNKDVLTQTEVLVALRTISPQDQKAIKAWIDAHDAGKHDEFMKSLASLPIGQAWFWSPGLLDVFDLIKVRRRETFDSSRTPKVGERVLQKKRKQKVPLHLLKEQMAAAIERAKESDPEHLKAKIRKLEAEASKKAEPPAPKEKIVEKGLPKSQINEIVRICNRVALEAGRFEKFVGKLMPLLNKVDPQPLRRQPPPIVARRWDLDSPDAPRRSARAPRPEAASGAEKNGKLGSGHRRILTVLAQYPDGRSKIQVAVIARYRHSGGGFNNYLCDLNTAGYIRRTGDQLQITESGLEALGSFDPLPTGRDLLRYWMEQKSLDRCAREILRVLADNDGLSKDTLAEMAGYAPNGGGFNNALSRLRSLELITRAEPFSLSPNLGG